MPRRWVRALAAVLLGCSPAAADEAFVPLDHALRRAALELTAGRPDDGSGVLARTIVDLPPSERTTFAELLRAQADLLAGRNLEAQARLTALAQDPDAFVRAQAQAHLQGEAALVLVAAPQDSSARAEAALRATAWESVRAEFDDEATSLGDLVAASVWSALGDSAAAERALAAAKHEPAVAAARLLIAERALARADAASAADAFEKLAAVDGDVWDGWARAWGRLGRARTSIARGDLAAARGSYARGVEVPALAACARLETARLAYAVADLDAAEAALADLDLAIWDPVLDVEARLLGLQVALDRGRFAAAESLASALDPVLAERLDPARPQSALVRVVVLDVPAWHASRARATLARLARSKVLRRSPDPSALAGDVEVVGLQSEADTTGGRIQLARLCAAEPETALDAAARDATWRLAAARSRAARMEAAFARAEVQLAVRREMLARGLAALDSTRGVLLGLEQGAAAMDASLAAHAARLGQLEADWRALIAGRVALLDRALQALREGTMRLDARYPDDRSVRRNEATARARVRAEGEARWIAAVESLRVEVAARFEPQLHAILAQYELGRDRAKLDSLHAWLAELAVDADSLALAVGRADAAERLAWAAADAARAEARAALAGAEADAAGTLAAASAARAARLQARRAAYAEAAHDARAAAAFHAALAAPPGDAQRLARLEHAAWSLQRFLELHPQAVRADEARYRLGEVHVQRAALQFQTDLAAFLAAGGEAEAAPLPVEDYAAGVEAFRTLLERHPDSPRARDAEFQLGFLLAEMGSPETSVAHLQRFLAGCDSTEVRCGRAALRLGDDHLALDQRVEAMHAFEIASRSNDPEASALGLFRAGWCAYDSDQHDAARTHLHALLERAVRESGTAAGDSTSRAVEMAPEALELLALAFAADHDARAAAVAIDAWGRPAYDFALLRRLAQLYTGRALYDEGIDAYELLIERYPMHAEQPALCEELLHWVEVRRGAAAAHARAAALAPRFAAGGAWAERSASAAPAAGAAGAAPAWRARWQSRLVEEDAEVVHADSIAAALARPEVAAQRMAQRLRAAAVHAHASARADSAATRADSATVQHRLHQAADLYEQTLKLFPNAADEPTTLLYLGEARADLGAHVDAADAYQASARHPRADSALVHRASGQELAALDAAAAADPKANLQRYDETANQYAHKWPQDGRSVDALERVGALAFGARDYARSEGAYAEVARRTPDSRRAARALKLTGDAAWQTERFETAAARYDSALTRARAAKDDSLSTALARLVPAALYRGAEDHEQHGRRDQAARSFETVAARHPQFTQADRGLYRAGGLRAAEGDSTAAARDYARLVERYPQSELQPDARLELGRCLAATGDPAGAARTYRAFALRFPQHEQAMGAHLQAGHLFEAAKAPAAADSQYAVVLSHAHPQGKPPADATLAADLWMRRAHLAKSPQRALPFYGRALECGAALPPPARAEAHFQRTEVARAAYVAAPLATADDKTLAAKQKALEPLLKGYAASAEAKVEPWHAAACLRLGESLADFGDGLRTAAPPAALEGDDLFAFQEALHAQATKLDDRAVEAWSSGLVAARDAKHEDTWTAALRAALYPKLATRVPVKPAPLFVVVQP